MLCGAYSRKMPGHRLIPEDGLVHEKVQRCCTESQERVENAELSPKATSSFWQTCPLRAGDGTVLLQAAPCIGRSQLVRLGLVLHRIKLTS